MNEKCHATVVSRGKTFVCVTRITGEGHKHQFAEQGRTADDIRRERMLRAGS